MDDSMKHDSANDSSPSSTTSEMEAAPLPKKPRYSPPRADRDTFATQEEFLNSLKTISIDDLDENNRTCAICRKPYREPPDPGFDNSEEPVSLRCGHAFGDKCLRDVFALPQRRTVKLRPLCFRPFSRGDILGRQLHTYFQMEGSNHDGNVEQTMSQLLDELDGRHRRVSTLDRYWYTALGRVFQITSVVVDMTLLEYGMIFDIKTREHHMPIPPLPPPGTTPLLDETPSEPVATAKSSVRDQIDFARSCNKKMLAGKLATVYREWKGLAHDKDATPPPPPAAECPFRYADIHVEVHAGQVDQTTYDIAYPPYIYSDIIADASDSESDENADSTQILESTLMLITRQSCGKCYKAEVPDMRNLPQVETLTWKDTKKAPDNCPLCKKVLFCRKIRRNI